MPHQEISEEELLLRKRARRRLIGAFVVVIAMVLVLPAVLEDKPQPVARDVSIILPPPVPPPAAVVEIPPTPAAEPRTTPALPKTPAVQNEPGAAAKSAPPQSAAKEVANEPLPKPAVPARTSPAITKAASERFQIQIGVFSNVDNVKQLQSKLGAQGIKLRTETLADGKIRVRSGPYASRQEADQVAEQLRGLGTQAVVIKAGDKSAQAR